jgi:hypothetical protein
MNPFRTEIAIRAYSEQPDEIPLGARPFRASVQPSGWSVIFDCETTIDATQALLVGFYQIRERNELFQEGIFFNPNTTTEDDRRLIDEYAAAHRLLVKTAAAFANDVLIKYGYTRCGTVIGFNLPFDLSRMAIDHGSARGHMRGGFSFRLTKAGDDPRIRVKHISSRSALIDFAVPGEQDVSRSGRREGRTVAPYRGHFVDVRTLAAALLSQRFNLGSLAEFLRTPTRKAQVEEHGHITPEYLEYARADVQTTWECFLELSDRYATHALDRPVGSLLSEASIGKAYLQKMGIKPFFDRNLFFPRQMLGRIMCPYYGGRAEVRRRKEICEVMYVDFKSMYPTVNALMGLWEFVVADSLTWTDTTNATRALLDAVDANSLRDPGLWRQLRTLVRVTPDQDVLPTRAKYDGRTFTIGLNYLTANQPLWYTLADCIVAKLLSGKLPTIEEAITFHPGKPQAGLKPVCVLGREDFRIDPNCDDLFTRLIDLRDEAKAQGDSAEKTFKILANASSYGIFIEVNRDDAPKPESLYVYGPDANFEASTTAIEEPGRYFNPLLGVLITGAARLMLGLAERNVLDLGLDWAFCDTDSLSIVRPNAMSRDAFRQNVQKVVDSFVSLNPYRKPGSILKLEEQNFRIGSNELEPLFCYAISAKRNALFNLDAQGRPILRKASRHGLGHLIDPYGDDDSTCANGPRVPLDEIGVRRWQHDLWIKVIEAAINRTPNRVAYDWHPALLRPAASRLAVTSPGLLKWLETWNSNRRYGQQIRPFGFLLAYSARSGLFATEDLVESLVEGALQRGRPRKVETPKPIAPFNSDPAKALYAVFDRETGDRVEPEQLKTYAESLGQYHLSPESKFENGRHWDRGRTHRRHVDAIAITLIGKEANRVGESGEADPIFSASQEFVEYESPEKGSDWSDDEGTVCR